MEEHKATEPGEEFSDSVDQMLAGEEPDLHATLGDDYRTAVDVARRLIRHRATPRDLFKAELRERLLSRLSEEEGQAKAGTGAGRGTMSRLVERLVPRHPIWRAATVVLLLAAISGSAVWGWVASTPTSKPPPIAGVVPTPSVHPVKIEATPSETAYLPGEEVIIEFSFKNTSGNSIAIDSSVPEIKVVRQKPYEVVWSLPASGGDVELRPGETVTYALVWDQQDIRGQQVTPSYYRVAAYYYISSEDSGIGEGETARVNSEARFVIEYAQIAPVDVEEEDTEAFES